VRGRRRASARLGGRVVVGVPTRSGVCGRRAGFRARSRRTVVARGQLRTGRARGRARPSAPGRGARPLVDRAQCRVDAGRLKRPKDRVEHDPLGATPADALTARGPVALLRPGAGVAGRQGAAAVADGHLPSAPAAADQPLQQRSTLARLVTRFRAWIRRSGRTTAAVGATVIGVWLVARGTINLL